MSVVGRKPSVGTTNFRLGAHLHGVHVLGGSKLLSPSRILGDCLISMPTAPTHTPAFGAGDAFIV